MLTAPAWDWNIYKQIFAEHWDTFRQAHARYQTPYYDELVAKMLACGNPEQIGYVEYRWRVGITLMPSPLLLERLRRVVEPRPEPAPRALAPEARARSGHHGSRLVIGYPHDVCARCLGRVFQDDCPPPLLLHCLAGNL